jgi:hypothetical protein
VTEGERFQPHAPTDAQDDLIRRMLAERGMIDQPVYGSAEDASTLIGALSDGSYLGRARRWEYEFKWGGVRF